MGMLDARSTEESGGLDKTEAFELLGNDRRRQALHYLMKHEDGVQLRELSKQVAAWENDVPVEEVSSDERRRVYVALHQTHLPRLDDAGVINYQNSGDTIRLTERGDDLRIYMEVVGKDDIPWSEFYLGLSALSGSAVAAAWLNLTPFTWLPTYGLAALIVSLYVVTSLVHIAVTRRQRLGRGRPPPGRR